MLQHFTREELQCPCCGTVKLALGFTEALELLRARIDRPMKVNSCCRCVKHNIKIGGHPSSLHLTENPVHPTGGTCAIDISAPTDEERAALATRAWSMGWSVLIYPTWLHLDRRVDFGLPQVFRAAK